MLHHKITQQLALEICTVQSFLPLLNGTSIPDYSWNYLYSSVKLPLLSFSPTCFVFGHNSLIQTQIMMILDSWKDNEEIYNVYMISKTMRQGQFIHVFVRTLISFDILSALPFL